MERGAVSAPFRRPRRLRCSVFLLWSPHTAELPNVRGLAVPAAAAGDRAAGPGALPRAPRRQPVDAGRYLQPE
eukprot:520211-Prymnesium_polylepis.1